MFQRSKDEWDAIGERIKSDIAATKVQSLQRDLDRERRRLALQDIKDRSLDVEIQSALTALETRQEALQGDRIGLKAQRNKTHFFETQTSLTERGYAIQLQIQAAELAQSEERLRQIRAVASTLQFKIQDPPIALPGGDDNVLY